MLDSNVEGRSVPESRSRIRPRDRLSSLAVFQQDEDNHAYP